jgi:RimJ/RimL family protein N-acetyltransferase
MESTVISHVRLRDIEQDDLPGMYEFNLDPDANRLAMTTPRSADAFEAHWEKVLADPNVIVKAICVADDLAGYISCFKLDGLDAVGYWVSKDFWGKGIASRALELLLKEVPVRPLHARVATGNRASLRVLQKCGFVVQSVQVSPANDRFLECEEALLVLE